jgi:DNA repair protein RadA/Sms
LVDAVLYFEEAGDQMRFLRATKNRFGSTDEVGLFSMGETGLSELLDPSGVFLVQREGGLPPGVVVAPVYEGSRILMVEIQALTVPAKSGVSRTYSDRIDTGRVSRVAAVLEKHVGVSFSDQDLYVNVAGGMRIAEVGIELPLAMALYSARTGKSVPKGLTVTGELSLAGEVRPVGNLARRVRAAAELGFTRTIGPQELRTTERADGIRPKGLSGVRRVGDCVNAVFGSG